MTHPDPEVEALAWKAYLAACEIYSLTPSMEQFRVRETEFIAIVNAITNPGS
jgi:hypothetical protein